MLLVADDLLADPHPLLGHHPLVDHRLLLAQLDGPLVRRHLGVTVAFTGRDRLALDAQLLPLDRDSPALLLGDDLLADAGLAARYLLGVDLQLLLGAGQRLVAGALPLVAGGVRTSGGGCGGWNGGRALGQPEDLLGLQHEVVDGQVADGLDPERLAQGLAAPLAKPAQGLDRGVGQLVDVAVLVSTVDVLPCLGSSHGWIASLVIRMVRRARRNRRRAARGMSASTSAGSQWLRSTRRRTDAVLLGRRHRRLGGYAGRP